MSNEYWVCIIGPAKRERLKMGVDLPMRAAVQPAFEAVTGHVADHCYSGWGCDEATFERLMAAWHVDRLVESTGDPAPAQTGEQS